MTYLAPPRGSRWLRRGIAGLLAALAMLLQPTARAWDFQGHMAIGIALHDYLQRVDPNLVKAIVELADALPRRDIMNEAIGSASGMERERLIFAYLSRWPDDIRKTERDRPKQHYRLHALTALSFMPPVIVGDAKDAYEHALFLLKTPLLPAEERATALAWLFHIVEDMHQPLHAGTWVSLSYPRSDEAGSLCYVRKALDGAPEDLHDFWDAAADVSDDDLTGAVKLADELARIERADLPELKADPLAFGTWEGESLALARSAVYLNGSLKRSRNRQDAPVLSTDYMDSAKTLAKHRMALATYRLTEILRLAFES